jgi:hypothetical protein
MLQEKNKKGKYFKMEIVTNEGIYLCRVLTTMMSLLLPQG